MSDDPFSPLNRPKPTSRKTEPDTPAWLCVVPVPLEAPQSPERHPKLGRPSLRWAYYDHAGALLGYACRFDGKEGKQFRPLVIFRPASGGTLEWRWEAWPAPRPLYGLDRLAQRPDAAVIVCEGEKAADAAERLLPGVVAVTSPNGSKSAGKTDWSPLRHRRVIIWPDADKAGRDYAEAVAELVTKAGVASVAMAAPPANVPQGWDAADAEADGWTKSQANALVDRARLLERSEANDKGKKERRPRQCDSLMALCEAIELWHAPDYEAFATIPINHHHENCPVRSAAFKRWLSARAYDELGIAPGAQAIEDTLRVLEARANCGLQQAPWRRVGRRGGKVYIDLADSSWRAIEVRADGWDVIEGLGLPFVRSPRMRPLCEPEAGYSIDALRNFANVANNDDFVLIIAWLVAALRDRGPYPILILNGEQGSGKSSFARLLRDLVDPSSPAIQGPPKDERDLVVSVHNAHILALDNLSHVATDLSDALCRLSTGSGFATRALHTDKEENIFEGARPILLNGIPALAERPDLAERALVIHLGTISESQRRPEDELAEDWASAKPQVLGALCDAISSALRRVKETRLTRAGRMADFEKWMTAAEPGLGWEAGTFSAAYDVNRRNSADAAFEANPVAMAIVDLLRDDHPRGWSGTATRLLEVLSPKVTETLKKTKLWPSTAQGMGNQIDRVKPLLRQRGIIIERKKSGERTISIMPKDEPAS